MGGKNWFEISGVLKNRGFKKTGDNKRNVPWFEKSRG